MTQQQSRIMELVSIGIYTAVYFLVVCFSTAFLKLTVPIFNSIMIPALNALLAGIVYLLVLDKVSRFGALTTIGSVTGLFFLITGHFPLAFVPGIVFSVLADTIQYKTKLPSKAKLYVGYTAFSFGLTGPLLPLWFMKRAYINELASRGKSQAYIDHVFSAITTTSFVVCMISIIIGGLVGMTIGLKIYAKYFAVQKGSIDASQD